MNRLLELKSATEPSVSRIEVGSGLLASGRLLELLRRRRGAVSIISDDVVGALYGCDMKRQLVEAGFRAELFLFPSGEENKTRETKADLEDQLFQSGFGKADRIVALGGGVVTDLAGFVAATYCRGVPLVSIPTTLLAMTDAAIGGKCGVNTRHGKNLVGAIVQPEAVLVDVDFLSTLPEALFREGIVETIKHGVIQDRTLFDFLNRCVGEILSGDSSVLEEAVQRSCQIKCSVVELDETERGGVRRQLNFGHTVGHALESVSRYGLSHGAAVSIGMVVEARLSVHMGLLASQALDEVVQILSIYDLPLEIPTGISADALVECMQRDKKAIGRRPRFVLLREIGACESFSGEFCVCVDDELLANVLRASGAA